MILNPYRFAAAADFGLASRDFDRASVEHITLSSDIGSLGTTYTVMAWAKLDVLNVDCSILEAAGTASATPVQYRILYLQSSGVILFAVRDSSNNVNSYSHSFSSANTWVHLALRRNGNTVEAFVNGQLVGSDATNTIGAIATTYHTIGTIKSSSGPLSAYAMDGHIADVRIYDSNIADADIDDVYNGTDYTTNLVGRWLGNDDNLLDLSGNDRDGYGLAPLIDNATFGDASRYFDGDNDFVSFASSNDQFNYIAGDKLFSFACWVRLEDVENTTTAQFIAGTALSGDSHGFRLLYDNTGSNKSLVFVARHTSGSETFTINNQITVNSEWHHIAFTGSGGGTSTIRFYLDGTEVTSTTMTARTNTNAVRDLRIGATANFTEDLNAYLADVRFYTDELTAQEVADLYAGTDVAGNLVHQYFVNTSDVADNAGSLNGTATGTTYQTADAGDLDTDGPAD